MSEWQPISTWDKENSGVVLVWLKNGVVPVTAHYNHAWYRKILLPQFREAGSGWYAVRPIASHAAKNFSVEWLQDFPLGLAREPTHWQPLPLPPDPQP